VLATVCRGVAGLGCDDSYMYISTGLFLHELGKNKYVQPISQIEPEGFISNADYVVKKITDRTGLFSLEIPSDWSVSIIGPQLSRISSISAGISKKSIKFSVIVSGEKREISSRDDPIDILVDGINAEYSIIEAPGFSKKKILVVEFLDKGKYYSLSLSYNPKSYPEGKDVFENIVGSFDVLDIKESAKVNYIEVVSSNLSPSQINILVKGEFLDNCTDIGEVTEDQNGYLFIVNMYTKSTSSLNCVQSSVLFEKMISLDTIGLKPGEYAVDVNDISKEFYIPGDDLIEGVEEEEGVRL